MKNRTTTILIIVACCMVGAGAALFLISSAIGGTSIGRIAASDNKIYTDADILSKSDKLDSFDSIETDSSSLNIEFYKGEGYSYDCKYYEDFEPEISVSNNTLHIKSPKKSFNLSLTLGVNDSNAVYVKVCVPDDDTLYRINCNQSSGSTSFDGINITGKLEETSGDFYIKGSNTTENLSAKMSSGDLAISDCKLSELKLDETSGNCELSNIECSSIVHTASSGDFELTDVTAEAFSTDITSGSVDVSRLDAKDIRCEATSGNIDLNLVGTSDDYNYDVRKTSGSVEIDDESIADDYHVDKDRDRSVTIDITSGDVDVEF